jgi:hypothetical protein
MSYATIGWNVDWKMVFVFNAQNKQKKEKVLIREYPKFFFMIIPSWLRIWGITIK